MRACAEIALGKNTTLLAMGRKKEKNYWKIKAQLSYLEEKSIVDEYIYLCMTDHKIWFCSEKNNYKGHPGGFLYTIPMVLSSRSSPRA